MTTFLQTLETFFWNVLNRPGLSDIADILIVAIIIYELLMLTRDTRGSAVLKGLAMLLLIVGISNLFGLTALNWLLMSVVNNGALVLVILFQPELRKALEQIGRGARIETKRRDTDKDEATRIIDEIIRCLQDLSRRHVGALIVFEQKRACRTSSRTASASTRGLPPACWKTSSSRTRPCMTAPSSSAASV